MTTPSSDLAPPDGVTFRRVDCGDVSLHVAEAGPADGRPVILLHGFPENWSSWRGQLAPLAAAGRRVIVPDQRGYGLSDRPPGIAAYHLDRLAADIVALGKAYGSERFDLVGHDWGGIVAWWIASLHPGCVERLAILNAPHPGILRSYMRRHPGQWLRSAYVGFFQLTGFAERRLLADDARALRHALLSSSRKGTFSQADLDAYARDWMRPGAMAAMLAWYRALVRLKRREPPRVRVPVLILWGRRDHALQPGLAEASLDHCEDGRLRWFAEATHWVQHEEGPAVAAALLAFLNGPPRSPR